MLLIQHGMGEHGGRYRELADDLAQNGIVTILPDLRGFGKSGGRRGCVSDFSDYFKDLQVIQRVERSELPANTPYFVLGHSFGGLVTASWIASDATNDCRGLVLTSPCFGLARPVPAWRHCLALAISRFLPNLTQSNNVDPETLTHDATVTARRRADFLIHDRISARLYVEMAHQQEVLEDIASKIHCPVLVLQAGDDRVVSRQATDRFFQKVASKDKKNKVFDTFYHEILNEINHDAVVAELRSWLINHIT